MTTWADDDDDVRDYDRRWRREEEADEQEEAIWDSIKPITVRDVDDAGNRTETVKKIRVFALTRAARPADIRDKLAPFGMAKTRTDGESLVSKEPPLPLELGSADKCERESRAELKRLLGEYLDEFRLAGKESAAQGAEEDGGERGDGGENGTWGNNRSTMASRNRAGGHASNEVRRRVRVCNVSDDIGERDLRNIFSANGATVDRVFLAVDKETGNNRGYAFITFTEEKWVDVAVRQRRFHYRNVVLSVSYAKDKIG